MLLVLMLLMPADAAAGGAGRGPRTTASRVETLLETRLETPKSKGPRSTIHPPRPQCDSCPGQPVRCACWCILLSSP